MYLKTIFLCDFISNYDGNTNKHSKKFLAESQELTTNNQGHENEIYNNKNHRFRNTVFPFGYTGILSAR
jgi:hypothetical protein